MARGPAGDCRRVVHATAHPWEESQLTLRRAGDTLEMEDIHHSGQLRLRRVQVPGGFYPADGGRGRKFAQLVGEIKTAIARRRAAGVDQQMDTSYTLWRQSS